MSNKKGIKELLHKVTAITLNSKTLNILHKVVMVGSSEVGKSALTLQFMYKELEYYVAN